MGRYLVRATCAGCHGIDLKGGTSGAVYVGSGPNLLVAAAYDGEQFRQLMRTGVALGGRNLGFMSAVAPLLYSSMTNAELDAVHDYVRTLANKGTR